MPGLEVVPYVTNGASNGGRFYLWLERDYTDFGDCPISKPESFGKWRFDRKQLLKLAAVGEADTVLRDRKRTRHVANVIYNILMRGSAHEAMLYYNAKTNRHCTGGADEKVLGILEMLSEPAVSWRRPDPRTIQPSAALIVFDVAAMRRRVDDVLVVEDAEDMVAEAADIMQAVRNGDLHAAERACQDWLRTVGAVPPRLLTDEQQEQIAELRQQVLAALGKTDEPSERLQ